MVVVGELAYWALESSNFAMPSGGCVGKQFLKGASHSHGQRLLWRGGRGLGGRLALQTIKETLIGLTWKWLVFC